MLRNFWPFWPWKPIFLDAFPWKTPFFWCNLSRKDPYIWGAWWHWYVTFICECLPPPPPPRLKDLKNSKWHYNLKRPRGSWSRMQSIVMINYSSRTTSPIQILMLCFSLSDYLDQNALKTLFFQKMMIILRKPKKHSQFWGHFHLYSINNNNNIILNDLALVLNCVSTLVSWVHLFWHNFWIFVIVTRPEFLLHPAPADTQCISSFVSHYLILQMYISLLKGTFFIRKKKLYQTWLPCHVLWSWEVVKNVAKYGFTTPQNIHFK